MPIVHTTTVARRDVPVYVRGIGQVQAFNTVQVKSRVDGQIMRVLFTEGQQVKVGDPLIEIDPRAYQAAVGQAEGALAKDQAMLQSAKADLDRASSLLKNGFASHQTYDQQTAAVGQLSASVKADQAALDNARLNQEFAIIRAPIAGRIGKRLVDAGNVIRASDGTDLADIVQLQPIAVTFTVPQDSLPQIHASQRDGALTVEARSGNDQAKLAEGHLTLIGNQIDAQTGTIELKASFENDDQALWPGQFVNARVIVRMHRGAAVVPTAAIQPGPTGKYVYVVDGKSSTVAMRPVTLQQNVHGLAVIEQGLEPGEMVAIDNQDQLAPGAQIKAEPVGDTPALTDNRAEATPS